jgi:membrane protein implicated in regulation of membrane protease activity
MMRAIAIILGLILLLFGLAVGGCAVVFLADSVMAGIEGPGADIAIMATVCLLIAAGLIAFAMWLLRRPEARQRGEDPKRGDSDTPTP